MFFEQSERQQPSDVESDVIVDGGSAKASLSLAQPARSSSESWHALGSVLVYSVSCVSESTVHSVKGFRLCLCVGELVVSRGGERRRVQMDGEYRERDARGGGTGAKARGSISYSIISCSRLESKTLGSHSVGFLTGHSAGGGLNVCAGGAGGAQDDGWPDGGEGWRPNAIRHPQHDAPATTGCKRTQRAVGRCDLAPSRAPRARSHTITGDTHRPRWARCWQRRSHPSGRQPVAREAVVRAGESGERVRASDVLASLAALWASSAAVPASSQRGPFYKYALLRPILTAPARASRHTAAKATFIVARIE